MKANGLGIDLSPEEESLQQQRQRQTQRRPLPAVPSLRPSPNRRTTAFSDRSPSVIGVSEAQEYSGEDLDLSEASDSTTTEDDPQEQQGVPSLSLPHPQPPFPPTQPLVSHKKLNHRRSASVDLTNFKPQPTPGHGLQAANPAHLRLRSQLSGGGGGGLAPPSQPRTLGRPKSMSELPHVQITRAPSPPSNTLHHHHRQPLGAHATHPSYSYYRHPDSPGSASESDPPSSSAAPARSASPSQQAMAQAHLLKAKSELNLRAAAAAARNLSPVESIGSSSSNSSASYGPCTTATSSHLDAPYESSAETVLTSPSIVESEFSAAERHESGQDPEVLKRHSTLLSGGGGGNNNTVRRQKELSRLLAPDSGRSSQTSGSSGPLKKEAVKAAARGASASAPSAGAGAGLKRKPSSPVMLEQAKHSGKARLELDVALESGLVVEGGLLKGRMEVKARSGGSPVWISAPKVRIVGFEELSSGDARHIFYHHAATITDMPSPFSNTKERYPLPCFEGEPDDEGYTQAARGTCSFPMTLRLPIGKGAKGSFKSKAGEVRYIVIGSIKLKAQDGSQRSIAHFYRHIDVYPYYDPTNTLRSLPEPLKSSSSKTMFMGGEGRVALTATIHRVNWVAGQQCYIGVEVKNDSSKKIKSMTLTLLRSITTFRPRPVAQEVDTESCQTQSNRKKVAETTLESGKKAAKGDVTAKGNWLGVEKGSTADFMHSILVPTDALTVARGKHLEVSYMVRVAVSASLGSDLAVEIPITIHNFLSLDPPPGHLASFTLTTTTTTAAGSETASPPKMMRQDSQASFAESNTAGHGRPDMPRLGHRSSLEFINTAIANAADHRQLQQPRSRVISRPVTLDEIEEQEDRSLEEAQENSSSEAEWEASHQILPLPEQPEYGDLSEDEEQQDDEMDDGGSVDEIETVLSLERPLASPVPGPDPQHRVAERRHTEPQLNRIPAQPQSFAFASNNSPVKARVSPEVARKSLGGHGQPASAASPRRVSVAGTNRPLPSLKTSPGPLRAHVVTPPSDEQPSTFSHVDNWLKSSVTASVGTRSPSSGQATLASPPEKLLSPYSPNLGRFEHQSHHRSPRSSPEPGLSPSEGYSTPSTVMAVTPPPEDDCEGRFGELQMDDSAATLSIPQTPKHMLKPSSGSPHQRAFSVDSSSGGGGGNTGVRSRVAALEAFSPAPSLCKAPSIYSEVSDASFKRIVRSQSTTSFKAPCVSLFIS